MPELEEINKIEIRSEEVQEIMGSSPRWIIRAGIGVIFIVIVIVLIGSWFFKYPDIIESGIVVTTQNPPASLKAMSHGKISDIFVREKDLVEKDQVIAIIENPANFDDVEKLEIILDTFNIENILQLELPFLKIGELQHNYSSFVRLATDYKNFILLDFYQEKIKALEQQKNDLSGYLNLLSNQKKLFQESLNIAQNQFNRDKSLFESGVYSQLDFEKSEKMFLQEKLSFENIKTSMANTQMQINQLDQQILDLKMQESSEMNNRIIAISESVENLKSLIKAWKFKFLIISPIYGEVTFTQFWSVNQNVQAGETVATIIPSAQTNKIGKLSIPSMGVGKVKLGQSVNIKFDNFPHMEFGLVRAKINNISLVPIVTQEGVFYTAEVELSDSLVSNYGIQLEFSQEMTGIAEIITDDVRLLERFVNPLRSLWKKNVHN
jgi:multidrug resistance efflux pump